MAIKMILFLRKVINYQKFLYFCYKLKSIQVSKVSGKFYKIFIFTRLNFSKIESFYVKYKKII